jgi:thiamine-phosphate pyrophosphorylase
VCPPHPIRDKRLKLCYVTDRKALPGPSAEQIPLLLDKTELVARAGVDWIQIREKDLSARELAALVAEAIRRVPPSCRILVNDRLDVAFALSAGGVHLGERSISVEQVKRLLAKEHPSWEFLVGVSTHSLDAAQSAQASGADYLVFGPVFATPSKASFGPPQGLNRLAEVCRSVSIPVIAIGGITAENARDCQRAGAAGIAAIRLFQDTADLQALVQNLHP